MADYSSKIDGNALIANKEIAKRMYWKARMKGLQWEAYFTDRNSPETRLGYTSYTYTHRACLAIASKALKKIASTVEAKFALLLTTLAVSAHKYSQQQDILVFTPVFGGVEKGNGKNKVLAVRLKISPESSFAEILKDSSKRIVQDFNNSNYPLEEVLQKTSQEISETPLIVLTIDGIQDPTGIDKLTPDLRFHFWLEEDFGFEIIYDQNKFTKRYVRNLAHAFLRLLVKLSENSAKPITQVSLLSSKEQKRVIAQMNSGQASFSDERPIVELIEEQALQNPQNIAVKGPWRSINYDQLNACSSAIAHELQRNGQDLNPVVALYFEPKVEMIVAIFAALKAGWAFLPLAPDQPEARVREMLASSGASVLLSTSDLIEQAPGCDKKIVVDTASLEPITSKNRSKPIGEVPAYIIFTSGTTGKPKGVQISTCNLNNYAHCLKAILGLSQKDSSLLTSSYSFDLGYTSIFPVLMAGGTLHLLPKTTYQLPEELLSYVDKQGISYLKITPTLFKMILSANNFGELQLQGLKRIVLGGEEVDPDDIAKFKETYPGVVFMNHYGPTETTVGAVTAEINDLDTFKNTPVIGKPLPGIEILILDNQGDLRPAGVPGELCIGGAGVGMGYLNEAELTAEKFVETPYASGKFYRSGDLARWLPDGNIQFLGRIDHQVKINGYRVEPSEIQSVLSKQESIRECAVCLKEKDNQKVLVAYYIAKGGLKSPDLRSSLKTELPEFMVPSYFIPVEKMPLTANGKLDHKALPEPELSTEGTVRSPMNDYEEKLSELWAKVLGLDKEDISMDKTFFELGGNSIRLIQLTSTLNKDLGLNLSITEMFQYPSIEVLAKYLMDAADTSKADYEHEVDQELSEMTGLIDNLNG